LAGSLPAKSINRPKAAANSARRKRFGASAAAFETKVSKPVLFAFKMTDFQEAHKRDSASAHRLAKRDEALGINGKLRGGVGVKARASRACYH
jgi:hypothetical protein